MSKTIVKKVRPFPFVAQFKNEEKQISFQANVVHIEQKGIIVETGLQTVHVMNQFQIEFTFPASKMHLSEIVQVIKTYDHYPPHPTHKMNQSQSQAEVSSEKKSSKNYKLAEMHFKNLSLKHANMIASFLHAIKKG